MEFAADKLALSMVTVGGFKGWACSENERSKIQHSSPLRSPMACGFPVALQRFEVVESVVGGGDW